MFSFVNQVNLFEEMADAAPIAWFEGIISRFNAGGEQEAKAELGNGLLKTSYRFPEESSAWSEDFIKKLPFGKFKKLFKISGEDFDKEAYAEIVSAIEEDYYEAIDTLDYDDFVSYLEDYDAETDSDDEKFADNYSDGKEKVITYDPVKKEYVK